MWKDVWEKGLPREHLFSVWREAWKGRNAGKVNVSSTRSEPSNEDIVTGRFSQILQHCGNCSHPRLRIESLPLIFLLKSNLQRNAYRVIWNDRLVFSLAFYTFGDSSKLLILVSCFFHYFNCWVPFNCMRVAYLSHFALGRYKGTTSLGLLLLPSRI